MRTWPRSRPPSTSPVADEDDRDVEDRAAAGRAGPPDRRGAGWPTTAAARTTTGTRPPVRCRPMSAWPPRPASTVPSWPPRRPRRRTGRTARPSPRRNPVPPGRPARPARPEAAELAALDNGTPVSAMNPGAYTAAWVRYYAGWCDKLDDEVLSSGEGGREYVRLEPYGVIAAIPPVERLDDGHGPEVRPCPGGGQHGGGQTARDRTLRHDAVRRAGARGRAASRRAQRGDRRARGRRRPGQSPAAWTRSASRAASSRPGR